MIFSPQSSISTTSLLRSWRKKDVPEKSLQGQSVSNVNGGVPLESQGPVARVAPHTHYPKPINDVNEAYRCQNQHYYQDYR